MASLSYLWKNRVKNPFLSKKYVKSWVKRLYNLRQFLIRSFRRYLYIRRGASIAKTAEIGKVVLMGKKKNLKIGEFSFLGKVNIALHDKVDIGNRVCINDGVEVLTASHDINDPNWSQKSQPIIIKDFAWIATKAIILPGVTIGKGAVVGAGAVIRKNVEDYSIVIGNPAITLPKKRNNNLVYNPCEFVASNRAWLN